MTVTTITFEEIMNELAKTGHASYANDSIHLSRVLSCYMMDIPVYDLVANPAPGDRQVFQSLNEFDVWTMVDQSFLRCADCGNFPRKGYWKAVKSGKNGREETNYCSLECAFKYLARLKKEAGDAEEPWDPLFSLTFSYETPKAHGIDSGISWSELTGMMWKLEIQCQECFAQWADRMEIKYSDMEPNKLTLKFKVKAAD